MFKSLEVGSAEVTPMGLEADGVSRNLDGALVKTSSLLELPSSNLIAGSGLEQEGASPKGDGDQLLQLGAISGEVAFE